MIRQLFRVVGSFGPEIGLTLSKIEGRTLTCGPVVSKITSRSSSTVTATSSESMSSESVASVARVITEKHLQTGDPLPPQKDGSLRLFSMKYCPFAQRPRLVLEAKGVEYEEVNCNLRHKPEFLLERHPDGKVPVLEQNGKVVIESNAICDLLDELYPNPPLYPKDPFKKANDRAVMELYSSKVIPAFYKAVRSGGQDEEVAAKLITGLGVFEAELKKRKTPFFSGEQPGMVDYNTWPFNERLLVSDKLIQAVKAKLPILDAYFQRMLASPAVKAIVNTKEDYQKFFVGYVTGNFQYDFPADSTEQGAQGSESRDQILSNL